MASIRYRVSKWCDEIVIGVYFAVSAPPFAVWNDDDMHYHIINETKSNEREEKNCFYFAFCLHWFSLASQIKVAHFRNFFWSLNMVHGQTSSIFKCCGFFYWARKIIAILKFQKKKIVCFPSSTSCATLIKKNAQTPWRWSWREKQRDCFEYWTSFSIILINLQGELPLILKTLRIHIRAQQSCRSLVFREILGNM